MDWADNMRGIQQMLAEGDGQLSEGPASTSISIVITPPTGEQQAQEAQMPSHVPPPTSPPPVTTGSEGSSGTQNSTAADATAGRNVTASTAAVATTPRAVVTAESDVKTRAMEYIRRDAEKKVAAIMESLGDDALAYNTIRKYKQQQHCILDIKTGEKTATADMGTMTTTLDGRLRLVEKDICLGQNQAWTYSLNMKSMECIGCRAHINYQPFPRRGSNVRGGRQVIWLTDQSMPPVLPVKSSGQECVKIFRLEGGMLQELSEGLVRILSGRQVAAGSAVLLTSATNMAAAGTAGYAEDLVAAIKFLRRSLGDHIIYGPLPNLLINGCGDWSVIKTSLEIGWWAMLAFKNSPALLQNSYRLLEKMLGDRAMNEPQQAMRTVLRLPLLDGSTVAVATGGDSIPTKIGMPKESEEKVVIICMIDEMRDRLAVDLDPAPAFNRWPDISMVQKSGAARTAMVVGSSHAGKLAAAMRRAGQHTEVVYESNWRATRDTVWDLAEKVRAKLDKTRIDVLVLCVLDNNIYYSLLDDGSTQAAVKDRDGNYHMVGDVIVSSKSAQHALFNLLLPLVESAGGKPCILCSPMPRYVTAGCCDDPSHVPNRRLRTYEQQLGGDLKETAEHFRDFLFTSGHKLVKVLEPAVSWRGKETSYIWGADPVHPNEKAYDLMADGVAMLLRSMESGARKRPRTNSNETGSSGRQPPLNRQQGRDGGTPGAARGRGAFAAGGARGGTVAPGRRGGRRGN
jgi:lysophospholipase L1-like esterase